MSVTNDKLMSMKHAQILYNDLADRVKTKASAIIGNETEYKHSNIYSESFTIVGNNYAFGNARYANKKDILAGYNRSFTQGSDINAVSYETHGNVLILNGSRTSGGDDFVLWELDVDMPAGDYVFKVEPYATGSTIENGKNIHLNIWYDGNETSTRDKQVSLWTVKTSTASQSFTTTNHAYKITVGGGCGNNNTFNNYKLYYSIFPSGTTFVDTEQTVVEGSTLVVTPSTHTPIVDTMMHKSTAEVIFDTKAYVDSQAPDGMVVKSDLNFITPEMYGAKGDGASDDTNAILACIAASKINNEMFIPIRGYGRYVISSPIVFSGRYADIFLNYIYYTGTDVAVKLTGSNCTFRFNYILAYGSGAVGLKIDATGTTGFNSNNLTCGCIRANSHTVLIASISGNAISYNVMHFTWLLASSYGDIFHYNTVSQCNENDIYGKYVVAHNGHFALSEGTGSTPIARFHQFCLEADVSYGIKGMQASLIQCRTDEFMGLAGTDPEYPKLGVLFDFDGVKAAGCFADRFTPMNLDTIDVSGALTYTDCLALATQQFSELPPDASTNEKHSILYYNLCLITSEYELFNCTERGALTLVPSGKIISYYNKKVFKPNADYYYKPTGSSFTPTSFFPTYFDAEDADSVFTLNLSDSYCFLAINKFKVKQYADAKVKVYDKLGNLIFDGTNEDAGVYEFECEFTRLPSLTLQWDGGSYNVPDIYVKAIYTNENEQWHIYKKNEIT